MSERIPNEGEVVERVRQIIRQFPENGLKQVLTSPENVSDLLALANAAVLPRIDFAGMEVDATTFVTAEYRHVSSDLVLKAALRPSQKGGRRKRLTVTILVELQSQPDRLMMLRILDYLVQIWKQQVRQHGQTHRSLASVKLTPVLPVVLHTGSYSWEGMGRLLDLMDDAEDFGEVTPAFAPLFVSLPDVAESDLDARGGYFGQVLTLLKARKEKREPFSQRLRQAVQKLRELEGDEGVRMRRVELLSYIEWLVYHWRDRKEHEPMRACVNEGLGGETLEIKMVRQTMADVLREEGRDEGRRQGILADRKRTLRRLIQIRWGLPAEVERAIEATEDADQLAAWIDRFAAAADLASMGIVPAS
jgi:hypothetical protein